jgi:hypothetical protein
LVDKLGESIGDQGRGLDDHDKRELAPFIVVASVEDNAIVAKHLEAARYPGVYLDLHAVRCRRENSLNGGLTGRELRFFYFADGKYPDSKPNPSDKRLFQAEPGSRYLFFLKYERGVLRSIGDVGNYSVLVTTGVHPEGWAKETDVGTLISEILLSPGNGANPGLMVKKLHEYRWRADYWGSRPLTVRLLRHLTTLPEPLRAAACGELVANYMGQDDCLRTIAADPNESPELRQDALREMKAREPTRLRFFDSLKDPASMEYLNWGGDSLRRMREEFETVLLGTDPVLHARACTALKRYFPWYPEPGCSGAAGEGPSR